MADFIDSKKKEYSKVSDSFRKTVSERLRDVLVSKGVQQKELAEHLGLTPQKISAFLNKNNSVTPNMEQIVAIAKYLDVSTDYLLGLSIVRKPELGISKEDGYIKLDKLVCLLGDNDIIEKLI